MQVCRTSGKKRVKRKLTTREKPAKVSKTCYRYGDVERLCSDKQELYTFLRERGLLHNFGPNCPYCMTWKFQVSGC